MNANQSCMVWLFVFLIPAALPIASSSTDRVNHGIALYVRHHSSGNEMALEDMEAFPPRRMGKSKKKRSSKSKYCRRKARTLCRRCQRVALQKWQSGRCKNTEKCEKELKSCLERKEKRRFHGNKCTGSLKKVLAELDQECNLPKEIKDEDIFDPWPDECLADNCPFCVGDDESWCNKSGGQCQDAVGAFRAGDINKAIDLLHYGKYCGREQRCSKNEGCTDQPESCTDSVDQACKIHDDCLDEAIKKFQDASEVCFDPASGLDIPPKERIACDATFVSTLYDISATASVTGSGPTGLCDEPFYDPDPSTGAGIHIVGHEATLMAAPFCSATLFPDDDSGCATYDQTEGCFPKAFYLCCAFNVNFQSGGNPPEGAVEKTCGPTPSP